MERRTMLKLPGGFGKVERIRKDASAQLKRDRHVRRTATFNKQRNISDKDMRDGQVFPPESVDEKIRNRKLALQKYKVDKEARKQAIKVQQKAPFKVGIPHHGSSPMLRELTNQNMLHGSKNSKKIESEVRRITRATTREDRNCNRIVIMANEIEQPKKLLKLKKINNINQQTMEIGNAPVPVQVFPFQNKKSVFNFQVQKAARSRKLTLPRTPTVLKRSAQKMNLKVKQRDLQPSIDSKKTKPSKPLVTLEALAVPLPQNEVFVDDSRELIIFKSDIKKKRNSPVPNTEQNERDLAHTSQRTATPPKMDVIAMKNSSKEQLSNNLDVISDDCDLMSKVSTPQGKKGNLKNKSSAEPERVEEVAMQRGRLDEETGRLLRLAEQWESLTVNEDVPTEVADEVDSVVGQTRLLTRDKFNQFRGLIDQFEQHEGQRPITVDDLNGFWDMVYIQVEVLTNKYGKLQELKENNWVEKEEFKMKSQITKKSKRPPKPSSSSKKYLHPNRTRTVGSSNNSDKNGTPS